MGNGRPGNRMEKNIKDCIMTRLPESDIINEKLEEAYREVRAMQERAGGREEELEVKKKKRIKKKSRKGKESSKISRTATKCGIAAAAVVLAMVFCVTNPALAAQLPLIGHIFEGLEGKVSYPGEYSENAIELQEVSGEEAADENEEETENGKEDEALFRVESGDLTVTLSEVTYDNNGMYLAVLVESKEGFASETSNEDIIYLKCNVDMLKADGGKDTFNEENGSGLAYMAEGTYVDSHTFQGIVQMRSPELKLSDYTGCDVAFLEFSQELTTGQTVTGTFPDSDEEYSFIEYDWKKYEGNWNFHLDFDLLPETEQQVMVNQVNEQGFGIEKVVKTEYEMYAVPILPGGPEENDYVVTIWDADGKPLDSHGSELEIRSIYGRDVSKVTVYLLKWEDFTESKGNNYYLQPEKAVFQTTVEFPQ